MLSLRIFKDYDGSILKVTLRTYFTKKWVFKSTVMLLEGYLIKMSFYSLKVKLLDLLLLNYHILFQLIELRHSLEVYQGNVYTISKSQVVKWFQQTTDGFITDIVDLENKLLTLPTDDTILIYKYKYKYKYRSLREELSELQMQSR